LICQFLVMDKAVAAMLWFNEWLGLDADLRLNEWLGFALMMPVVFRPFVPGAVADDVCTQDRRRQRAGIQRQTAHCWFRHVDLRAVITPSVDPISMLWLWVPMCGLYELGILLCIYQGEQTTLFDWEEEEKKEGELVEV